MSQFPKPGRIACCVPFCRRTGKAGDYGEIICGAHWRLADRSLTRRYKRWYRKTVNATELDPVDYSPRQLRDIARMINLCEQMWDRIKTQVRERAAGIS